MRYFFMPVMEMGDEERSKAGGFVPPDVLKAARKDPENWYVEWREGGKAEYFVNTNAIDYDKPLVIRED